MKKILILSLLIISSIITYAQQDFRGSDYRYWNHVSIGKGDSTSTNTNVWLEIGKLNTTKAILLPRSDTASVTKVFSALMFELGDTAFYYHDGIRWRRLIDSIYLSNRSNLFIQNSTNPQSGNFNIHGNGTIIDSLANSTTGNQASNITNTINWTSVITPASGSLYATNFNTNIENFSDTETFPNSSIISTNFDRLQLTSSVNSIITMTGGSGTKRVASAKGIQIYLPSITTGLVTTISDVAGLNIQSVYQDGGTTNSVKITNYYGLLLGQSDENLAYGAITHKYGIYQDGALDTNVFKGTINLPSLGSASGTTLVLDGNNNIKLLTSSRRFKENISPITNIDRIYKINGVNYNYKTDSSKTTTAGMIAEQMDSLGFKDVVLYDKLGKPFSLQYNAVIPYLIEVLKEQKKDIDYLKKKVNKLSKK